MDVRMSHIDGIAATATLMRMAVAPRVLVLTTFETAAVLVVSVETVKTDVGTVLTKLDARDRTNAAVLAWRSGFVS